MTKVAVEGSVWRNKRQAVSMVTVEGLVWRNKRQAVSRVAGERSVRTAI